MTDFAFIRLPDGTAWLGEGPFDGSDRPPSDVAAFYVNDFDLSDPEPWKIPSTLHQVTPATLGATLGWTNAALPRVVWQKPATEWFKMAFRRIRRDVLARRLEKMVPVLTECGTVTSGSAVRLMERLMGGPENTWGYACAARGKGFMGLTPELLFRSEGRKVETMALAGTAKPGAQNVFEQDVKEIEEHEIVVRYLSERLDRLGDVTREARQSRVAGGLLHFQSVIRASLKNDADPAALVPWLHPTPAVGCLPREELWLKRLHDYRQQLDAPGFFGAPFGFIKDGVCQVVVAIRGIAWEGERMLLPSGCGIVGGSAFDHEWRELRLKREVVVKQLGL